MLSKRQNFYETIKPNGKPDRIIKQFEGLSFLSGDPVAVFIRGNRYRGMPPMKDRWGTATLWPEDVISSMPHVTEKTKVIRDVTTWREFTKVPDVIANCSPAELWEPFLERVAQVNRSEELVLVHAPTGVFERLHFLMGFEDTFINLMTEPEAMKDLCEAIGEYRYNGMKLLVDYVKPDAIISHDDWGSKNNLFMQPEIWREFIKPQYIKSYSYLHDNDVVILHHADSFMEQIVEDMVDLHIDIWQGVIPQNDIVKIQKQLNGRMALMGGIDAAIVDREDSSEEEIRAETRRALETYCPNGHFIPSITYGGPGTIFPKADQFINDEIERYNQVRF